LKYKFESGKDIYVTLPKNISSHGASVDCCPYEYGNSVYVSRAEIIDFKNGSVGTRTEKPAHGATATTISDQYARITLYDDYGNKKAFYIIRK
jgi:hypothetical protein